MAFLLRLLQYVGYGVLIAFAVTVFLVATSWIVYYIRVVLISFSKFWMAQAKSDALNIIRKIFPPRIDKF